MKDIFIVAEMGTCVLTSTVQYTPSYRKYFLVSQVIFDENRCALSQRFESFLCFKNMCHFYLQGNFTETKKAILLEISSDFQVGLL